MTQFPHDDPELVKFLRQHCPQPPPVSPELEEGILGAIELADSEIHPARPRLPAQRRHRWLAPSAIAASLIAGLIGYHTVVQRQTSKAELASLEAFLEDTWYGTVNDGSDGDIFPNESLNSL